MPMDYGPAGASGCGWGQSQALVEARVWVGALCSSEGASQQGKLSWLGSDSSLEAGESDSTAEEAESRVVHATPSPWRRGPCVRAAEAQVWVGGQGPVLRRGVETPGRQGAASRAGSSGRLRVGRGRCFLGGAEAAPGRWRSGRGRGRRAGGGAALRPARGPGKRRRRRREQRRGGAAAAGTPGRAGAPLAERTGRARRPTMPARAARRGEPRAEASGSARPVAPAAARPGPDERRPRPPAQPEMSARSRKQVRCAAGLRGRKRPWACGARLEAAGPGRAALRGPQAGAAGAGPGARRPGRGRGAPLGPRREL